jgi:hypothetical protein
MLRGRGVHYDVGLQDGPNCTRDRFDVAQARADMAVITEQLHANVVRISGTDLTRVAEAAQAAADAGLAVWYSPFPVDLNRDDLISYLAEAADGAEKLRAQGHPVTFVTGCELSLFCHGFLPGQNLDERLAALTGGIPTPELGAAVGQLPALLNQALRLAAAAARARFGGPVTYSAGAWEPVDWAAFDVVSVDLYRDKNNAAGYRDLIRSYLGHGKPMTVTEFGCCTYTGAADAGGAGFVVVDFDTDPPSLKMALHRNEAEQARYLTELLAIFDNEGVDTAFWHTFASWTLPHRPDPRKDTDMGAFGLVKITERSPGDDSGDGGVTWEPKDSFHALAAAYQSGPGH